MPTESYHLVPSFRVKTRLIPQRDQQNFDDGIGKVFEEPGEQSLLLFLLEVVAPVPLARCGDPAPRVSPVIHSRGRDWS